MIHTIVTADNWRNNEEFKSFLTLSYTIPKELALQCSVLLPIAVAEERLLGSIKESILRDAFSLWNAPVRRHIFFRIPSLDRWTYKGTDLSTSGMWTVALHGRLVRPLARGLFCHEPHKEMIDDDKRLVEYA